MPDSQDFNYKGLIDKFKEAMERIGTKNTEITESICTGLENFMKKKPKEPREVIYKRVSGEIRNIEQKIFPPEGLTSEEIELEQEEKNLSFLKKELNRKEDILNFRKHIFKSYILLKSTGKIKHPFFILLLMTFLRKKADAYIKKINIPAEIERDRNEIRNSQKEIGDLENRIKKYKDDQSAAVRDSKLSATVIETLMIGQLSKEELSQMDISDLVDTLDVFVSRKPQEPMLRLKDAGFNTITALKKIKHILSALQGKSAILEPSSSISENIKALREDYQRQPAFTDTERKEIQEELNAIQEKLKSLYPKKECSQLLETKPEDISESKPTPKERKKPSLFKRSEPAANAEDTTESFLSMGNK